MRNNKACVSDPNSFFTCSGEEFRLEFSPRIKGDGTISLEVSGRINIKEFINSQRNQTDMSYIMKQIELGNADVLNQRVGMFGDFTDTPHTLAEALQLRIDAESSFLRLPTEVKQRFDNDFNRYFATAGSKEWYEKLGIKTLSESEVKADSSVVQSNNES